MFGRSKGESGMFGVWETMSNSNIIIINHDLVSLFALFCYVGARRRRPMNEWENGYTVLHLVLFGVFKSWSTYIHTYIAIDGIGISTLPWPSDQVQHKVFSGNRYNVACCLLQLARYRLPACTAWPAWLTLPEQREIVINLISTTPPWRCSIRHGLCSSLALSVVRCVRLGAFFIGYANIQWKEWVYLGSTYP